MVAKKSPTNAVRSNDLVRGPDRPLKNRVKTNESANSAYPQLQSKPVLKRWIMVFAGPFPMTVIALLTLLLILRTFFASVSNEALAAFSIGAFTLVRSQHHLTQLLYGSPKVESSNVVGPIKKFAKDALKKYRDKRRIQDKVEPNKS
jgi:hypothetical protein